MMADKPANTAMSRLVLQNGSMPLRLPSVAAASSVSSSPALLPSSSGQPMSVSFCKLRKPRPLVLTSGSGGVGGGGGGGPVVRPLLVTARPRVISVATGASQSAPRIFLVPRTQPATVARAPPATAVLPAARPDTSTVGGVRVVTRPPTGRLKVISKPANPPPTAPSVRPAVPLPGGTAGTINSSLMRLPYSVTLAEQSANNSAGGVAKSLLRQSKVPPHSDSLSEPLPQTNDTALAPAAFPRKNFKKRVLPSHMTPHAAAAAAAAAHARVNGCDMSTPRAPRVPPEHARDDSRPSSLSRKRPTVKSTGAEIAHESQPPPVTAPPLPPPPSLSKPLLSWDLDLMGGGGGGDLASVEIVDTPSPRYHVPDPVPDPDCDPSTMRTLWSQKPHKKRVTKTPHAAAGVTRPCQVSAAADIASSSCSSLSPSADSGPAEKHLRHIDDDWAFIKRSLQTDESAHTFLQRSQLSSLKFGQQPARKRSLDNLSDRCFVEATGPSDEFNGGGGGPPLNPAKKRSGVGSGPGAVDRKPKKRQDAGADGTPLVKKKRGRPKKPDDERRRGMSDYWKHKVLSPQHEPATASANTSVSAISLSAETSQHVDDIISSVIAASSDTLPSTPDAAAASAAVTVTSPAAPAAAAAAAAAVAGADLKHQSASQLVLSPVHSLTTTALATPPPPPVAAANASASATADHTHSSLPIASDMKNTPVLPLSFAVHQHQQQQQQYGSDTLTVFAGVCQQVMERLTDILCHSLSTTAAAAATTTSTTTTILPLAVQRGKLFVMSDELYTQGAMFTDSVETAAESVCDEEPQVLPASGDVLPATVSAGRVASFVADQLCRRVGDNSDQLQHAALGRLCSVHITESSGVIVFVDDSPVPVPESEAAASEHATVDQSVGGDDCSIAAVAAAAAAVDVTPDAAAADDTRHAAAAAAVDDVTHDDVAADVTPAITADAAAVTPAAAAAALAPAVPNVSLAAAAAGAVAAVADGAWHCNRCPGRFSSLSDQLLHQLLVHMVQHDRVVCAGCPLVARRCGATTATAPAPHLFHQQLADLLRHFVRHLEPVSGALLAPAADPVIRQLASDGSSMQLACGSCPRQFATGCAFGEHELACVRLRHVCATCGSRHDDADQLAGHQLEHRRAEDGRYSCDLCPCCFNKVEQLAAHRRFHFKEKNIACRQCDKKFVSAAMLNMHVKWKHSDGPCRFCTRHFNSATARKVHEEHSHLKQLALMCDTCQLRVATPSQLRVHKRVHAPQLPPPHACRHCGERFVSRGLLRKHIAAEHTTPSSSAPPSRAESPPPDTHQQQQLQQQQQPASDGELSVDSGAGASGGGGGTAGLLRDIFNIYRTSFDGVTGAMTLSDLETESDEEEQQSQRDIAATRQLFQHKDKQTKSVWSCPLCQAYFTKLWGVRAHITLKHPGANVSPVLHDASQSAAASKKAFLRELKRKVRFAKKQDRLALKMQERMARYGSGGPRRGRPLKNPLFAARPRKPSLPPPADGVPRKRGRPRKVPLAPGQQPPPPKTPKTPKVKADATAAAAAAASDAKRENADPPGVTMQERRRWQCDECAHVHDSYDDLVTHTYAQHPHLSLPRFSVLVDKVPLSTPSTPTAAAAAPPPAPSPAAAATTATFSPPAERGRGSVSRGRGGSISRRARGRFLGDRRRVSGHIMPTDSGDLYRRQYNTLSGSRRHTARPPLKHHQSSKTAPSPPALPAATAPAPSQPSAAAAAAAVAPRLYCVCQVPYQEGVEMIGCDGEHCKNEWFHFQCVNIVSAPKGNWYCPDCATN